MDNVFDDEEQLSMDSLMNLPMLDFPDEAELFPDALLHTSEDSCSGGDGTDRNSGIDRNYGYEDGSFASVLSAYYPSADASNFSALMEAQPAFNAEAEQNAECLQQPPPPYFSMEGLPEPLDHIGSFAVAADEYSPNSMDRLLGVLPPPPPWPRSQEPSLIQSVYDGDYRSLSSSPFAAATTTTIPTTAYLAADSGLSGLYHGGFGLPLCNVGGGSREWKGFFPGDGVPMQFPAMDYPDMAAGFYSLQNNFQRDPFGSGDVQFMVDAPLQKHQSSSPFVAACGSPTPLASDISSLDESAFKVGRISPEEKKEKIHRYLKKKNQRNFSKKIKYACRKTLADSRPRVRGRFAKNEEFGEAARTGASNHDYDDDYDEVLAKDEHSYDFSFM